MVSTDTALKARLLETLVLTGRKLRKRFNARVVELGLTYPRARALAVLSRSHGPTQSELACELELEGPTVVRLLDGMERLGLIERCNVEGDRRAKHIRLTEHGETQAKVVGGITLEIRDDLLAGISDEEMRIALKVLERVLEAGETHAA